MRRWAFLVLFSACSTKTPCLALVEQACLMAKEKERAPKGSPEEAKKACDEARARAEKADDAMNAACAEDPSTYRKSIQAPKKSTPSTPPK
jgi:hypothetical protein